MVADLDESGLWAGRQCLDGGSSNQAVAILAMFKGSSSPILASSLRWGNSLRTWRNQSNGS